LTTGFGAGEREHAVALGVRLDPDGAAGGRAVQERRGRVNDRLASDD